MLFGSLRFLSKGWVYDLYIRPKFFFTYYGFEWVKPLPGNWMYLPFILMAVASVGIIIGYRYRFSAILFFLGFTYVELLDKTNYLNHYYFVSLVAFLMCWLPANADFSLDAKRDPSLRRSEIPAWTVMLLQVQLGIVYFFAGIAKLNSDWLIEAQPLRTWLQTFRDMPVLGDLFATKWLAYVFSWFGCFYDLTVPFFLSYRKTRPYAYFFVIVFHLITWLLFPIGVFPWVMIFSALIFFPAAFHEKWLSGIKKLTNWEPFAPIAFKTGKRKLISTLLGIYLIVQLTIPMRYLVYPGDLFWTEEGFRFSWRVMLMDKDGYATFYIVDRKSKGSIVISNRDYLTPAQEKEMSTQPDMILQYGQFLGKQFHDTLLVYGKQQVHLHDPAVEAEVYVTLNGRPHQLLIGRNTDLMREKYSLEHRTWLKPYTE